MTILTYLIIALAGVLILVGLWWFLRARPVEEGAPPARQGKRLVNKDASRKKEK